ncbi:MAG: glycosyltransferase family 2 protein, partial [bacterium]|nr:glycosyltransferase family 2 protein [bacterium]
PVTLRDALVVGGCLLAEPGSLPALWRLVKCLPRAVRKRRQIMSRRKASDERLASWFVEQPPSRPLTAPAARSGAVASEVSSVFSEV